GHLSAFTDKTVLEKEVVISSRSNRIEIEIRPTDPGKRIDIKLTLPERTSVTVETNDGAVMITGDLALIDATTVTGTVAVDVPVDDLRNDVMGTESHPRFVSDIELNKIKEKWAGRFVIQGETADPKLKKKTEPVEDPGGETVTTADPPPDEQKPEGPKKK